MKRRNARRVSDPERLGENMLEHLVHGFCLDPEPTLEEARAAWLQHRQEVIDAAKAEPFFKHLAPWALFEFECGDAARKQLSGPEPLVHRPLWFGEPRHWRSQEDSEMAEFEPERDFLERLGYDPDTLRRARP